jgi:hypothetical protein
MTREHYDPTWQPYCIRCDTMARMLPKGFYTDDSGQKIQKFACKCGAKHERVYPEENNEAQ